MSNHPLVLQLRFARSEFLRGLEGVSARDAVRRFEPMNCISWIVGHLAAQENAYWNVIAQGKLLYPQLNRLVGYGSPPSTPPLGEMWDAWHEIIASADVYLDTLTPEIMQAYLTYREKPRKESVGTTLMRNIFHYWFHTGEAYAIRQMLGHRKLPEFVGNMSNAAYRPE